MKKHREKTALHWASISNKQDIIKILLISRKDIDINIKDGNGETALDCAKRHNLVNIVKILENHELGRGKRVKKSTARFGF